MTESACSDHDKRISLQGKDIENLQKELSRSEGVQELMAQDLKKLDDKVSKGFEEINTKLKDAVSEINLKINNLGWKLFLLAVVVAYAPKTLEFVVKLFHP